MKRPSQIKYNGRTYRLAADAAEQVAPDTILETAANPVENASAPAAPDVGEGDRKMLTLLHESVASKAKALLDGLAPLMDSLGDRDKADQVLQTAKANLDGLREDFQLLTSKYSGYMRRQPTE